MENCVYKILYSGCLDTEEEFTDLERLINRNFVGRLGEFRRQAKIPFVYEPDRFTGRIIEIQKGESSREKPQDTFLRLKIADEQGKTVELFMGFLAFVILNTRSIAYAQPEIDTLDRYRRMKCWVFYLG